jgi:hypothetical protein
MMQRMMVFQTVSIQWTQLFRLASSFTTRDRKHARITRLFPRQEMQGSLLFIPAEKHGFSDYEWNSFWGLALRRAAWGGLPCMQVEKTEGEPAISYRREDRPPYEKPICVRPFTSPQHVLIARDRCRLTTV